MARTVEQKARKAVTMRLWRQRNRDHVREYKRLDYHRNREQIVASRKKKRSNPESLRRARERWSRWYASPSGRAKHNETVGAWRKQNPGRLKKLALASYYRHHEKNIAAARLRRERDKSDPVKHAKLRAYMRVKSAQYNAARKAVDVNYKLACGLRSRVSGLLRRYKATRVGRTIDLIGCSIQHLREHLESQFRDGMSWDNYGMNGWHIDHETPITRFDLTNPEQQKACFSWKNLQPLWALDNIRKGNRMDWQAAA